MEKNDRGRTRQPLTNELQSLCELPRLALKERGLQRHFKTQTVAEDIFLSREFFCGADFPHATNLPGHNRVNRNPKILSHSVKTSKTSHTMSSKHFTNMTRETLES